MSIAVTCPSGHLLKVADNMAGRAGRCPFCREIVNVPLLSRSAAKAPLSKVPPVVVAPDPAAADTVLMPLSLGEMTGSEDSAHAGQQAVSEPDSPVVAEPELMAQTLPLPTAELMPKRSIGQPDLSHDIGFDTAGHKTRIIGSWKVLGDVEPPYISQSTLGRGAGAAVGVSDAKTALSAIGGANSAARTASVSLPTPPPLPSAKKEKGDILVFQKSRMSPFFVRATVYRIAVGLVLVSVFSMWPAIRYWDLGVAPGWARGVLLVALLELAYAAWLVSIPDWASLWSTMFVLAIVATLYGTAAAMTLATPMEHEPPLGLQSVRHAAPAWCFCMMLLTISAAYICGHAAQRIRRVGQRS